VHALPPGTSPNCADPPLRRPASGSGLCTSCCHMPAPGPGCQGPISAGCAAVSSLRLLSPPPRTLRTPLMSVSMRAKRCVASGSSRLTSSLPMKSDSRYAQVLWISDSSCARRWVLVGGKRGCRCLCGGGGGVGHRRQTSFWRATWQPNQQSKRPPRLHDVRDGHQLLVPARDGVPEGGHVSVGHHALHQHLVVLQHLAGGGARQCSVAAQRFRDCIS
jgi:hypothetical protein